jgi:ABC-type nitrate/sulfonate/bicarbonate transport system ATPase subunit
MIEFDRVTFSYGERVILSDFSLICRAGTTTSILGPSGCGKSTIVSLACGLLRPQAGRIVGPADEDVSLGSVRGVLFQDDTLIPWLSAGANAAFPGNPIAPAMMSRLEVIFQAFGLSRSIDLKPAELSMGMKKRVELARAICADESCLLGDEPFAGLDLAQRKELWNYWRSEVETKGKTSLLISHDIDEALHLSDVIILLDHRSPTRVQLRCERQNGAFPDTSREQVLRAILDNRVN